MRQHGETRDERRGRETRAERDWETRVKRDWETREPPVYLLPEYRAWAVGIDA